MHPLRHEGERGEAKGVDFRALYPGWKGTGKKISRSYPFVKSYLSISSVNGIRTSYRLPFRRKCTVYEPLN